jgi:hypothetical protein
LGDNVFRQFLWAGNPQAMSELLDSSSMNALLLAIDRSFLRSNLEPLPEITKELSPSDQERRRQVDLWKASKSTLLQDAHVQRANNQENNCQDRKFSQLTNDLLGLLPPNTKTKDLKEQIGSIWDDAVRLDMAMNTQASGLYMYYVNRHKEPMRLDDTRMEVEMEGNSAALNSDAVTCVLASALERRGEPDGTRLAYRTFLVKMLVLCQSGGMTSQGKVL